MKMYSPSILPTDIIPIINLAWDASFAHVKVNKHVIAHESDLLEEREINKMDAERVMKSKEKLEEAKKLMAMLNFEFHILSVYHP